jgi:hypothetical protein
MQRSFLSLRLLTRLGAGALLALALVFAGCDSNDDDEQTVDEVVIVGTQVEDDFLQTGQFGLSATPLDVDGSSILRDDLQAEVELETDDGTTPLEVALTATVNVSNVNQPSNDPLAVSVNIDGSGSMASNDPNRARVSGAQSFVNVLDQRASAWETAMFQYEGSPNQAPDGTQFSDVELLEDFSSDVTALENAADEVDASGGTPTYESLAEILIYSEDQKPFSSFRKAIVLLSDGQPNSTALRDSVCNDATRKESPIYSIGLGPASDISQFPSQFAIDEMRAIANCTSGAYAGIDPTDVDSSTAVIYNAIATATSLGNVVFNVQVQDSDLSQLAPPGTRINGTLTITSGGQTASGNFAFTVPSSSSPLQTQPDYKIHPSDLQ